MSSGETELPRPRVFSWDWKEQPPMEEIAQALPGQPHMKIVRDTGGDCYACVLSAWKLTEDEAQAVYDQDVAGPDDEEW